MKALNLKVANWVLEIRGLEGEFVEEFKKHYYLFLSEEKPRFSLEIIFSEEPKSINTEEAGLKFLNSRKIVILDDYIISEIDFLQGYGKIKINPQSFLYSLGTILRNLFILLLVLKDKGLVFHAVGILNEGAVDIFFGPTQAGKTTVANLSKDKVVLSDDLILVREEEAKFVVYPTPNWGDLQYGEKNNRAYPLRRIFRLIKDKNNYLEKISLSQSLAEVFTIPHIAPEFVPYPELIERYERLLSKTDYYRLHFLPDNSFWRLIG
ncbi:MAG: hypothetical protein N2Z79_03310 [Candidatus Omnitrophica bacterium]|nr:hypothetical protein [Candidatus Omnitrophota bacterium]